jgi:hypothetical protein
MNTSIMGFNAISKIPNTTTLMWLHEVLKLLLQEFESLLRISMI